MSLYNFAFINNAATIYFYKSSRKNAKIIKHLNINHLINKNDESRKIAPDRMKIVFFGILEYLSYYTAPAHIDIAISCNEWKNAIINGKKESQNWCWETGRLHFDGFTTAAHWLYFNLFTRIYPYCEIDFTEIETDSNYKYLKKEWEKHNG